MRFRVLSTVSVLFLFAFTGVAVAQPDPVAAPKEPSRASAAAAPVRWSPHGAAAPAAPSTGSAEKPTPPLTAVETGRWTVELEAQANVSRAAAIDNRDARIATVRRTLVRTANRSQAAVVAALEAAGAPFESFWLRNSVVFSGDDALAEQIRGVPGVAAVRPERIYPLVRPVETAAAVAAAAGDPEWGVDKIGADEAWAFGVTGPAASSSATSTPASTSPTRRWSTSTAATTATAPSPTTTTGGTRPASAATSRATTSATARTRWARWSAATAPGRSPRTSASRRAPAGSPPRAARTSAARRARCSSAGEFILAPTDLAGANPDPDLAPRHRQQLLGRRPRRPLLLETRQRLAGGRDHPGVLVGQPRPGLRCRRLARRLPRVVQRRRHRHRRRHRRLLRPRAVRVRQDQPGRRRLPASTSCRASPATATRPSRARRWPHPTSRGRSP